MNKTNTKLIFLAEDDEDDCEMFEDCVRAINKGHTLRIFGNGELLMQEINAGGEQVPDLIFLDLNMPRKGGRECLAEIRKLRRYSKVPVIILTTSSNTDDMHCLEELGASLFIVKPNTYQRLVEILKEVLSLDFKGRKFKIISKKS